MAIDLTVQQRAVVDDRGGDLLVSAAAGSGKTRVLVERLMAYVEGGADIDRFLIITFTNAAAAELRDRIAGAIHQRMALHPENRHLRRNAALVYHAPICTIDAFCMDFLRQWGHLAGLDPDFRHCDDPEGEELRARAMETVLENRYANIDADPDFAALVDALAEERGDRRLEEMVRYIHGKVQAQADPARWLKERQEDFRLPEGAMPEDTVWGRELLDDAVGLVEYWLERLEETRKDIACDAVVDMNYGPAYDGLLESLESLREGLREGWEAAAGRFPLNAPDAGRKRGGDTALRDRARDLRAACRKQVGEVEKLLSVSARDVMADLARVRAPMAALLAVTDEYDREFTRLKRRRRLTDFNDCEHLTARLLADENGRPTQLARDLGQRYVEIMVDEYQDTNAIQNLLFRSLSNGANLFMVGDVKQSIYRFRLADPTIFLEKYARFADYTEAKEGEGRRILLSENFRSRPEVLESANFIFKNVMTARAAELDYTDAEALKAGRKDLTPDERYRTELCCVDLSGVTGGEEGKTPKDLIEARAVAHRIRELLDSGLPVGDRPVRPEDVVILIRSPKSVLRYYTSALEERGIPWSAGGGREFYQTTEVSVALSLLNIVDNPVQDVPLLAVLRSPLVNFSADRLAELRAESRGSLYAALQAGAARGEQDCADFLALLEELRDLAAEESSHRLLWYIYDRTDLPAIFAAMPDGQHRRANLMALYDEACRFESGGHRGLMAFLLHMSRKAEMDKPVAVSEGDVGGVRIMSVHNSKGLEFPVVFLCGLERKFNERDYSSPILFHPELGLGPVCTDRQRMLSYTTVAREAVILRLRHQLRAEEMRLLYVAMTRAEHKLFLVAAVNGRQKTLKSLAEKAGCPPSVREMAEVSSMADWVMAAALCRKECLPLWDGLEAEHPGFPADPGLTWDVRRMDGALYESSPGPAAVKAETAVREELPADLAERLAWRYGHTAAADIPSKLTATQLKGREKDREAAEEGVELRPAAPNVTLRRPVFGGERPLTPAQKGTALHMTMQYLNYAQTDSRQQVEEEIARLVTGQYITPKQGEAVDPEDILAFFRSDLGQRLKKSGQIQREFKFSLLAPAKDYYSDGGEDEVLLQGVVDCWFREKDGSVTVVDFKTDRVTAATVRARAEEYRPQLDVYTRALSAVEGESRVRRYLWFFAVGEAVEM